MTQGNGSERSVEFARAQALFHEALARPADERRRFLKDACKDSAILLAEVSGMLEEDADGSSLLDDGIALTAHQILRPVEGFSLGQEVGPYRLIRLLGEGGMGFVYLAERHDFGNQVAIKFLRDAWLSPSRRERFLLEQRLLAPLNHPSIARFYDAGTFGDRMPWFAMEYVEGLTVTDHCRVTRCTIDQRMRLFRSVCEAVQYAHEHAVIHRDLKPSNILVKQDGSVRLLDFGIGKQISDLQDPLNQTRTALRLMTPAYAAPEQIRGEPVGVFTDVYALGAILFELLAGQPLFDLSKTPLADPWGCWHSNPSRSCLA